MNDVVTSIESWLKRYKSCNQHEESKIASLLSHLYTIQKITDLKDALMKVYIPSEAEKGQKLHCYLRGKIAHCNNVITSEKKVTNLLTGLQENKTDKLIAFCKQVLNNPQALLHGNILSVLKPLEEMQNLNQLLAFLAHLPDNPSALSPNEANFGAQKPTDDLHRQIIQLLHNVAYKVQHTPNHDKDYNLAQTANGLLQNLLIIHKEIQPSIFKQIIMPNCSIL